MNRSFGFSTGALAKGDFANALRVLSPFHLPCIELSALRLSEVVPFMLAVPTLRTLPYRYVSFHAPSRFDAAEERWLVDILEQNLPSSWPIVLHPDTIHDPELWKRFHNQLAIENMDRRKAIGRSALELGAVFDALPDASLCFDIGHARQYDSSMTEAFRILSFFQSKLVQVHISEVNSQSQHDSISLGSKLAFQEVASLIPEDIPVIIESRVLESHISQELTHAAEALFVRSCGVEGRGKVRVETCVLAPALLH